MLGIKNKDEIDPGDRNETASDGHQHVPSLAFHYTSLRRLGISAQGCIICANLIGIELEAEALIRLVGARVAAIAK